MLTFHCILTNPWSEKFDSGHCWDGSLSKTKAWEVQLYRSNVIFEFLFKVKIKYDHPGIELNLGLFSFNISFLVYDNRHWDTMS